MGAGSVVTIMPKRPAPSVLQLWTAAKVNREFTMAEWFRDYALKKTKLLPAATTTTTKSATTTTTRGLEVTDFPSVAKKVTKDGATNPSMSTFQVTILPAKQQRRVLQSMLRVSNVAYNWADYLVTKCNFRPSLYGLQKVVART
jgi:hypothetical protein